MTHPEDRPHPDTISQPIPDRRGPGRGPWLWLIGLAAILIVGAVIYGSTNADQQQAANPPAVVTSPAPAPNTPPPAPQTTTGRNVTPPPAPAGQ